MSLKCMDNFWKNWKLNLPWAIIYQFLNIIIIRFLKMLAIPSADAMVESRVLDIYNWWYNYFIILDKFNAMRLSKNTWTITTASVGFGVGFML